VCVVNPALRVYRIYCFHIFQAQASPAMDVYVWFFPHMQIGISVFITLLDNVGLRVENLRVENLRVENLDVGVRGGNWKRERAIGDEG